MPERSSLVPDRNEATSSDETALSGADDASLSVPPSICMDVTAVPGDATSVPSPVFTTLRVHSSSSSASDFVATAATSTYSVGLCPSDPITVYFAKRLFMTVS